MELIEDERKLDRMGIPPVFRAASFAKIPDDCPHKEVVLKFAGDIEDHVRKGYGLLMYGENSRGKTALSTMLLRCLPKGMWGLFVVSEKIPKYIIERTEFDPYEKYIDRMRSVDLLVLDEIVIHNTDTFRDTCIESVLRDRVMDQKSTIITTNWTPDRLRKEYSSMYEVLREAVLPVQVEGHNFRSERAGKMMGDILK